MEGNLNSGEFVDRHHRRPFFLYLCYHSVHVPIEAKADKVAHFEEKLRRRPSGLGEQGNAHYAAMVQSVDDGVGRIVETLRKHDLDLLFRQRRPGASQPCGPTHAGHHQHAFAKRQGVPLQRRDSRAVHNLPPRLDRAGRWKLLEHYETGRLELFDLEADIGERTNLVSERPDKTRELHALLKTWRTQCNAQMPTRPNPGYKGGVEVQGSAE